MKDKGIFFTGLHIKENPWGRWMSALPEIEKHSVFNTESIWWRDCIVRQCCLVAHSGLRVCALCGDEVERRLQKKRCAGKWLRSHTSSLHICYLFTCCPWLLGMEQDGRGGAGVHGLETQPPVFSSLKGTSTSACMWLGLLWGTYHLKAHYSSLSILVPLC